MYKSRGGNALASQYKKRQTNLQRAETTNKHSETEIDELFDTLAQGNDQLDVADLISYMNSLGSQYRDSIMLKILRIYQVQQVQAKEAI
jgi:hypothetical protein